MSSHRFSQVDVFADGPLSGNPLAVVHDAVGVETERMQAFTRWTNLSEAAFLLPPDDPGADYRVRIFEPKSELPFAGHPTLGSCAAWLAAGGRPTDGIVVQECGAGLVRIAVRDGVLAFAAPPILRDEAAGADDIARAVELLGLSDGDVVAARWIDNGPGWLGVLLADARSVLDVAQPTKTAYDVAIGIAGLHDRDASGGVDLEVRAFFSDAAGVIREDPVTGSLNASLAQWLLGTGRLVAPYVARQTTGRVDVYVEGGDVWIGGRVDVVVDGTVRFDG